MYHYKLFIINLNIVYMLKTNLFITHFNYNNLNFSYLNEQEGINGMYG